MQKNELESAASIKRALLQIEEVMEVNQHLDLHSSETDDPAYFIGIIGQGKTQVTSTVRVPDHYKGFSSLALSQEQQLFVNSQSPQER